MTSLQCAQDSGVYLFPHVSATAAVAETARYEIDPEHTTIGFSARHMMVSQVQGQFMVFDGFIEMDPEAKTVKTIEANIIGDLVGQHQSS